MKHHLLFTLAVAAAWPMAASAELKLPAIIGDNMVLQQKQLGKIWGWDKPSQQVKVRFAGQEKAVQTGADGRWSVQLDPGAASDKPAIMTIEGSSKRELKNILVGEVWVCSGQSNMQWNVGSALDADLEYLNANYPKVRLISVPQVGTQEPQSDFKGQWAECSAGSVPNFSAVGFFFGRSLHQALNVPVGLINNAWGGSAAEAWVRRDVLEKDPRFAQLMAGTVANEKNLTSPASKAKWDKDFTAWKTQADDAKKSGKPFNGRPPISPDNWLHGNARPGNIYNGVLLPTIGYGIKGVIWYQGESNAGRAHEYGSLFPLMITHWRTEWQQGDFPFYWVQLADFQDVIADANVATNTTWPELREAQTKTQSAIKNGGQAVIVDLGEGKDIHPKNKRDVAERLLRLALAKDYGFTKMIHRSPEYKSMAVAGNAVTVTLDTFGSTLNTFDTVNVQGFVVCGADRKWVWADAMVSGANTVTVSSPDVAKPVAVRYAWTNNPVCNLINKESMPVTPFRSDDFPMITAPK
jgi:sialate O-acetylesterase